MKVLQRAIFLAAAALGLGALAVLAIPLAWGQSIQYGYTATDETGAPVGMEGSAAIDWNLCLRVMEDPETQIDMQRLAQRFEAPPGTTVFARCDPEAPTERTYTVPEPETGG